ncbi:MAG: hypothetical protein BWK77_04070 [Verrucomicrobia bacterium A1]|nr:MAG: hypothetical protein BWK77_04070 [Verrucomicrobia bacterium A1]
MKLLAISGLTLLAVISSGIRVAAEPAQPGWVLVWQDEFDGPAVDTTKWRVEDAALVKNNERQYYAPDEVYIENGHLVLRSRKRTQGDREYTSGLVETKGKFAQAFGRFEIRAKLPRSQGIWPAHWLLPEDGSWPPEIDIMECVGSQPDLVTMSLHMGEWPALESQSGDFIGPDFSQDFHVFALEWAPGELRWTVDDVERFFTTDNVPQVPMYLILNTAVGGDMPGEPDETTALPQVHQIDYVRIYAKDVPGAFFLVASADNGRIGITPKEPRYATGSVVTLKAVPSIGYKFSHWSGAAEGAENPIVITMDGHKTVSAHFETDAAAPLLLSKGKPVTASSVEKDGLEPQNAVDGDRGTRWSSAFSDFEWIMVDLGEVHPIEAIRLDWENAYGRNYKIDVSDDGTTWRNIHSKTGGRGGVEEIIRIAGSGRFVRLTGLQRAREWGYSLWELGVYGK